MSTLQPSEIFFIISSVGFVVLGVLAIVFLYYLIRATRAFSRIMDRIEKDVDMISDTTKDMLRDIHESALFGFIFGKTRKSRSDSARK